MERSCRWTWTIRGFIDQVGHSNGGRWCLSKEGLGRHCVGQHSPRTERCWLQERKPATVGESYDVLVAVYPTTSSVGPWKV